MKNYIILALSILLVISVSWLGVEIKSDDYKKIKKVVDSTTTVKRDTVFAPDTTRSIDVDVGEADTVIKDTVIKTEVDTFRTQPDNKFTRIRTYNTQVNDSLLTGNIRSTVQGFLVSQNFSYTPQYPLQINIRTNTRVRERVTRTQRRKPYPSIGLHVTSDLSTNHGLAFEGSWTMSNGNSFRYSYNPTLEAHTVGISYNLRNLFK